MLAGAANIDVADSPEEKVMREKAASVCHEATAVEEDETVDVFVVDANRKMNHDASADIGRLQALSSKIVASHKLLSKRSDQKDEEEVLHTHMQTKNINQTDLNNVGDDYQSPAHSFKVLYDIRSKDGTSLPPMPVNRSVAGPSSMSQDNNDDQNSKLGALYDIIKKR